MSASTFLTVYTEELARAATEHPEEYAFPPSFAPVVAQRMLDAMPNGYHLNGRALRATCKRLGIKFNRAALAQFVEVR